MKRILLPLLSFMAYMGLIGMGASADRYSPSAKSLDLSLLAIHLGLGALLSILVLKERFGPGKSKPTILQQFERWRTDEPSLTK